MCRMVFNSLLTVIVSFVSCSREHCRIPLVSNGHLVGFEVKHDYNPYRWWTVHTKVPKNTMVDEGKQLKLQCDEGYEPNASQGFVFTCREGRLSPEPQCVTKRCQAHSVSNGELQSLKNTKIPEGAFLEERQKIKLKCADGYQHSARSLSEAAITCWRKKLLPEPECTANITKKKPIFYCSFNEESDCARETTSGVDKWEAHHRNSSGHSCLRIVLNEGENSTVSFTTRFEGKEARMCLTMHLNSGSVPPGQGGRSNATVHTVTNYPQSSRNHDIQLPKDYFEADMDTEETMLSVSFFVLPGNPPQFLEIHRIEVQEGKCHPSGD